MGRPAANGELKTQGVFEGRKHLSMAAAFGKTKFESVLPF
jgi:hypothetical protein